jgi:hypothetical protein
MHRPLKARPAGAQLAVNASAPGTSPAAVILRAAAGSTPARTRPGAPGSCHCEQDDTLLVKAARDNHGMHLVIPYASALSDAAVQALGTLSLPNLERLLARWAPVDDAAGADLPDADEYALSLPHERLLARLRGWPVRDGLLPFAAEAARRDGFAPEPGSGWGLLTPAHWHVGRDQVNLVDPALLELDEPEARTLHDTLAPLFTDLGWTWH